MPLYTPLSGSWLNMAESIQRILVRRALAGETPTSPDDIIDWLEATARGWNADPTPFELGRQAPAPSPAQPPTPPPCPRRLRCLHSPPRPSATYRPRSMASFMPSDPLAAGRLRPQRRRPAGPGQPAAHAWRRDRDRSGAAEGGQRTGTSGALRGRVVALPDLPEPLNLRARVVRLVEAAPEHLSPRDRRDLRGCPTRGARADHPLRPASPARPTPPRNDVMLDQEQSWLAPLAASMVGSPDQLPRRSDGRSRCGPA